MITALIKGVLLEHSSKGCYTKHRKERSFGYGIKRLRERADCF